jgi:uncharacterized protein (TIGR03086 family)
MDTVALMNRVLDEMTRLVDGVQPAQLTSPTPCTDWTVRDPINHVAGGSQMVGMSIEKGSVPDELVGQFMAGDNLGDDPKGSFHRAADYVKGCYSAPGALEKMVTLPFGQMPGEAALKFGAFDVTTHAADLARATGQDLSDPDLCAEALVIGRQLVGPELRQPGVFDPEQPAPAGASASDALLAFAGRKI